MWKLLKHNFYGDDESKADIARTVSLKCIRVVLAMLHPYSPFITEELWSKFKKPEASDLIITPWPEKETKSK
jgi:Valyl-tRNA synthetase